MTLSADELVVEAYEGYGCHVECGDYTIDKADLVGVYELRCPDIRHSYLKYTQAIHGKEEESHRV